MLPRVQLVDDTTTRIVATFECNAPQAFGATRSFAGGVLRIPFRQIEPQAGCVPLLVHGSLAWHDESDGLLIPAQPISRNINYLEAPITNEQIISFERKRGGNIAMLQLRLRGVVAVDGAPVAVTMNYPTSIVVPIEEWLKVLALLGQGQRRLIELPAPPTGLGAAWEDAAKSLANATRRFAGGDIAVAMSEGRVALERAVEAIGDVVGRPRSDGESVKGYFDAVAAEIDKRHVKRGDDPFAVLADSIRMGYKIFGFTSDPVHNGFDAGERANAELALTLVTGLYSYFARLRPVLYRKGVADGTGNVV